MTNTYKHAKREFELLDDNKSYTSDIMQYKDEILSICEKFGKTGHSGSSSHYVSSLISESIKKLLSQETISPLTGEDSEWNDVSVYSATNRKLYQNNRNSAVFKENGYCYYIDGIIKCNEDGSNSVGGNLWIDDNNQIDRCYIKSFPFTPKKFYLKVKLINNKSYVDNMDELKEVMKYYYFNTSDFRNDKINDIINVK